MASKTSKAPYSLAQVVTDGPLTAPRWVQHLVKIATHAVVALLIGVLFHRSSLHAAIIGGPALWLVLMIHEHIWPTDRQPLTDWQHVADWITDYSLSCVPLAVVLAARHDRIGSALLAGAIIAAYVGCHRDARP